MSHFSEKENRPTHAEWIAAPWHFVFDRLSLYYLRFVFTWYPSSIIIYHFPRQEVPSLPSCQAGHWHSLTRRTRRCSCPPPAGQILFTGFTMTVCRPSLAHHAKIGQELDDQRQGYPLEVGGGERGNSGGKKRKRNRWSNGQRKRAISWKKGLSWDLAVLYHN